MSRLHSSSHPQEIQDTLHWIRKNGTYAVLDPQSEERRAFMPFKTLYAYFADNNKTRLNDVLIAVFHPEEPPLDADDILQNHVAVFCILLEIGLGKYIHHFTSQWELNDDRLPFDPARMPGHFPIAGEDPNFYKNFCSKQWKFCAPIFRYSMTNIHFEEERILPIVEKELIAGGGSAMLYRIRLHGSYNKLDPEGAESTNSLANTYVLKTYITQDAIKYYTSEVDAFRKLKRKSDGSLIGFFGSYIQGGSYNIILEYADKGPLELYMKETPPPVKGEDIINFWDGLFIVIKALKSIHDIEVNGVDGPHILHGWHQDVKPTNILVKSNKNGSVYEYYFKLADLGLSHFKKVMDGQGDDTANDAHGTRAYGAPECYRLDDFLAQSRFKVKPKVDVWSLGCVFSEAAVWVAHGYHAVLTYRQQRRIETDKLTGFRDGDCFHDGTSVLQTVRRWHVDILPDLRRADYITGAVLAMIKDMLVVSEYRLEASQVWGKSQTILHDARERLKTANGTAAVAGHSPPPREPPEQPPNGPFPPPPGPQGISYAERTLTKDSKRPTRDDFAMGSHSPPMIVGRRNHSPDSISTTGDGSPVGVHRSYSSGHRRPSTQPMYSGYSAKQAYPYSYHQSDYLQEPRISEEDQPYGNVAQQTFRNGAGLKDGRRVREGQPQLASQQPRNSIQAFPTTGFNIPIENFAGLPFGNQPVQPDDSYMVMPQQQQKQHTRSPSFLIPTGSPTQHPTVLERQQIQERQSNADPFVSSQRQTAEQVSRRKDTPTAQPQPQPPYLSVAEAALWKAAKKNKSIFSSRQPQLLPHEYLRERLKKRDHLIPFLAFLIDDAGSMKPHWRELTQLVDILAYIVKTYDPDGVEMFYTISSAKSVKSRDASTLVKSLERTQPAGFSDISIQLSSILEGYKSKLHKAFGAGSERTANSRKDLRPLSLYVLTDGRWQPHCDAESPIKNLVQKLVNVKIMDKKQVGIQFISFGNNQEGLDRMEVLDSKMKVEGKKIKLDIVDTEPSNGNVWKMLLGAIDPWFDDDLEKVDSEESVASSSTAVTRHSNGER